MGGFHGGHSSGGHHSGGYHGGHHSSYRRGGYSSVHIVAPVVHTHRVIDGKHYIDGKRYYGPYYGSKNGKPISFISAMLMGLFLFLLGVVLFLVFFVVPADSKAVVRDVEVAYDPYDYDGNPYYYEYNFDYTYHGKSYVGVGTDDYQVKNGQQYTIYVVWASPANYRFSSTNVFAFLLGGGLGVAGLFFCIATINTRRKHQKLLEEVGDANGDGVINDADIEYVESGNRGQAEGRYEGMKEATKTATMYEERKKIKCPYCDSLVEVTDKFCQNCGAALGK